MVPAGSLANAPRAARHPVRPRQPRWSEHALVGPVEFALAQETGTFDRAFRLIHDQYVWRDYMAPDPSRRRFNLRHALPSTRMFVAKAWPRVIGTVTLFRDSALALPMDDLYKQEMDALRARGRRIVEASHLATDPETRSHGLAVLMRMFRMMLVYAAELVRLDDLCLVINPRHAEYYEKFFECRVFGPVKHYDNVNGAPAVPLRLDLDLVRQRIEEARAGREPANQILAFLYEPAAVREIIAQLRVEMPRASFTAEQFAHFFDGSSVLRNAPLEHRIFVQSLHTDPRSLTDSLAPVLSMLEYMTAPRTPILALS